MNRRWKFYVVTIMCGAVLALPLLRDALAQSYPKLVTNGNGLALTRLAIHERQGGNWVGSPSLRQGVDYRLTVRLTSYFPNDLFQWVVLNKTYFNLTLPGATFFVTDQYYGTGQANRFQSNPDREPLEPTKSKSHSVYFRWNGTSGNVATPLVKIFVAVDGWEERPLPNPTEVPIPPTS